MSATTLYFILILDNLRDTLIGLTLISSVIAVTAGLFMFFSLQDGEEKLVRSSRKILIRSAIVAVVASIVLVFVPTTKQAAVIAVLPPLVNSEAVQSEAKELYDLAKSWLKDVTTSGPAAESE